jgi:amino acid adenylation domain-containing protein
LKVAAQYPTAPALSTSTETIIYDDLVAMAAHLAAELRSMDVKPGDLVALCLPRSASQISAQLAVWLAGCAFLPLDPAWPDERLRTIIQDAKCSVVLADAETEARARTLTTLPIVKCDEDRRSPSPRPANQPIALPSGDDLAYVIYTSGSSGTPKGVEISHANLAHLIAWHNEAFQISRDDRAAHMASVGFDAAIWEVWPYLSMGATVALANEHVRTAADAFKAWLEKERITIAFAPTAIAEQLIQMRWEEGSALRYLLTGADTLHSFPPAGLPFEFVNNYGPTECTVVATSGMISAREESAELPTIGRPIAGAELLILTDAGELAVPGEIGELYIGGGGVGLGYRGRADLTAERFVTAPAARCEGRYYRTGDLAAWTVEGEIAFHGRADDQVKIRGFRVELAEVASAIDSHPAVKLAVAAVQSDQGRQQLVGYVVLHDGVTMTATALRSFLEGRLPEFMLPSAFVRLDALPLTSNGKVDRNALPAPKADNRLADPAFVAPATPAEERLAAIISAATGHANIGADDNFFLLGGHSLLGAQIVLQASDAFGVELTLRDLFLAPTVRQLAGRVEDLVLAMIEDMSDDDALKLSVG